MDFATTNTIPASHYRTIIKLRSRHYVRQAWFNPGRSQTSECEMVETQRAHALLQCDEFIPMCLPQPTRRQKYHWPYPQRCFLLHGGKFTGSSISNYMSLELSSQRLKISSLNGRRDSCVHVLSHALPARQTPSSSVVDKNYLWKALCTITELKNPHVNLGKLLLLNSMRRVEQHASTR
ncbi:hypothetical protein BDZ89DRAFT_1077842 [Hymenopellis radicata]|nr:hypothetical protein BDZ89DRAFT_1077842 [Hymenopellis radicata]